MLTQLCDISLLSLKCILIEAAVAIDFDIAHQRSRKTERNAIILQFQDKQNVKCGETSVILMTVVTLGLITKRHEDVTTKNHAFLVVKKI